MKGSFPRKSRWETENGNKQPALWVCMPAGRQIEGLNNMPAGYLPRNAEGVKVGWFWGGGLPGMRVRETDSFRSNPLKHRPDAANPIRQL